jgi:hypothetical protein
LTKSTTRDGISDLTPIASNITNLSGFEVVLVETERSRFLDFDSQESHAPQCVAQQIAASVYSALGLSVLWHLIHYAGAIATIKRYYQTL